MYICTTFENVPPHKMYYVFFRKLVKKTYVYVPEKTYTFPKKRVRTSFWTYVHVFPGVRGHASTSYVLRTSIIRYYMIRCDDGRYLIGRLGLPVVVVVRLQSIRRPFKNQTLQVSLIIRADECQTDVIEDPRAARSIEDRASLTVVKKSHERSMSYDMT
jgi:hypothetical protein